MGIGDGLGLGHKQVKCGHQNKRCGLGIMPSRGYRLLASKREDSARGLVCW